MKMEGQGDACSALAGWRVQVAYPDASLGPRADVCRPHSGFPPPGRLGIGKWRRDLPHGEKQPCWAVGKFAKIEMQVTAPDLLEIDTALSEIKVHGGRMNEEQIKVVDQTV